MVQRYLFGCLYKPGTVTYTSQTASPTSNVYTTIQRYCYCCSCCCCVCFAFPSDPFTWTNQSWLIPLPFLSTCSSLGCRRVFLSEMSWCSWFPFQKSCSVPLVQNKSKPLTVILVLTKDWFAKARKSIIKVVQLELYAVGIPIDNCGRKLFSDRG